MKKGRKLELRMHGLVPYNISPIQQGIQFGHAVVEYGLKYFKDKNYQEWAKHHKTFIILNGGTTNGNILHLGTMQKHLAELKKNGIKVATFYETDLNNSLTSIVFLVDERVFDNYNYSLEWTQMHRCEELLGGKQNVFLKQYLTQFKLA